MVSPTSCGRPRGPVLVKGRNGCAWYVLLASSTRVGAGVRGAAAWRDFGGGGSTKMAHKIAVEMLKKAKLFCDIYFSSSSTGCEYKNKS